MRILNVVYCSRRLSVVNVVTAGARLRFTLDVRASSVAFTAVARRLVVSIIWVHTIVIQKAAQYTHARSHTYVSACTMATALEHVSAKGGATRRAFPTALARHPIVTVTVQPKSQR